MIEKKLKKIPTKIMEYIEGNTKERKCEKKE